MASNLQAFIMTLIKCATYVSTLHLIFTQLVIFLPLAMVWNLEKLSTTALVMDAFTWFGSSIFSGMNLLCWHAME